MRVGDPRHRQDARRFTGAARADLQPRQRGEDKGPAAAPARSTTFDFSTFRPSTFRPPHHPEKKAGMRVGDPRHGQSGGHRTFRLFDLRIRRCRASRFSVWFLDSVLWTLVSGLRILPFHKRGPRKPKGSSNAGFSREISSESMFKFPLAQLPPRLHVPSS